MDYLSLFKPLLYPLSAFLCAKVIIWVCGRVYHFHKSFNRLRK